ncbi:erythromycin esterase family protein [Haloparvum sp. AD34]
MPPLQDRRSWSEPSGVEAAIDDVEASSRVVSGPGELDDLVRYLGDSTFVLFGEASHGTSEFYRWRAELTARLIAEYDFDFVAVEGDWTSCYAVNRYLKGLPGAADSAREVLESFDRWPTWMWANWEIDGFLEWLASYNQEPAGAEVGGHDVGFYGLDVYGLFESMHAVVDYLEEIDPDAADMAREAYRCFEPYGEDAREYGRSTRMVPKSCESEVVDVLTALRESAPTYETGAPDDYFAAEQNALVARNAEEYYRSLASGHQDSWNVRDTHMADTLDRLVEHHGGDAKAIVWAHNTHVGDARATDMAERDRLNIGQLVRERNPAADVDLVGFGTHRGSVIAGDEWGAEMEELRVPEAKAGSYEDVFHRAGAENRLLYTDDVADGGGLAEPRGHRAIGVVYRPALESGNYVPTDLRERYDVYLHVDETQALHPLDLHPDRTAVPELYPTGL